MMPDGIPVHRLLNNSLDVLLVYHTDLVDLMAEVGRESKEISG
jgi:hypothetical protein